MNNLIKGIVTIICIALITSCAYEDFESDFVYSTVYFPNQKLKRTFVEGEVNTINIGIVLGGKRVNNKNESVTFTITDTDGLADNGYTLLQDDYYSLSSYDEFVIPIGKFMGEISMTINPEFYSDSLSLHEEYAIPFRLLSSTTDSIFSGKDTLLLVLDFEHQLFGNYYHNGQVLRFDTLTGEIVDTIIYHQEEPVTNPINNWYLNTIGRGKLETRGLAQYAPSDLSGFFIEVNDDNTFNLLENPDLAALGYDWQFEQIDGNSNRYDADEKEMYLNYKFIDVVTGYESIATDTLIFRNRILDGVNQWDF